ncbi:hypothetical protein JL720_11292 [Aureococcus anophagefferens]|nr:hypothetical protein JL720_11292 [Aureococcus anophagefferens]
MLSGCGIFCEEASRHVDDDFAEYEEDTFDEVEGFDGAGRFEYMFVSNDEPGEAKEETRAAPAADAEAVDGLEREHASLPPMRRRTLERLYFYDPPHSEQLHDRKGRPIKVFATARLDKAGMRAADVDTAALARYHLLHMERLRRGREDRRPVLGDPSLGILEIFDVKDATISLFRRSFDEIIACARINESRYPGLVGITLIVNAPSTFGYCYAFVRPFLSYETQRRIEVVPGDPRKRIGELVDDANIPREAYRLSPDGRP